MVYRSTAHAWMRLVKLILRVDGRGGGGGSHCSLFTGRLSSIFVTLCCCTHQDNTRIYARGWVSFIFIRVHFATSHGTKSIKLIKKGKRELWTESVELFHSGNATRLFVIIFFSFRFALFTDYSGGDAMFHVLGLCANTQYSNWCEPSINFIVCTENNWAKNALFCLFRFALHRIITDASINIMTNNRAEHYCAFPVDFPLQKNGRKNPLHQ